MRYRRCASASQLATDMHARTQASTHLGHDLADLPEVRAPPQAAACEEVLDEPRADVVAHLLELLVDLSGGCVELVEDPALD